MAHEEAILEIMEALVIADKHTVGDIMAHKGLWNAGVSSVNNSYKALTTLVDQGKLEKGDGYFRTIGCRSEYKEHAQLLTKALAEIQKLNYQTKILREPTLDEIGLRPDAIVFLTKEDKGLCFILEVCNNEFPSFLTQKVNAWKGWDGAKERLSQFFGEVKEFDIVVAGEIEAEGTFNFNSYMEAINEE
jgi:hypothetical protein